jgi:hypothetical protein
MLPQSYHPAPAALTAPVNATHESAIRQRLDRAKDPVRGPQDILSQRAEAKNVKNLQSVPKSDARSLPMGIFAFRRVRLRHLECPYL